MESEINQSPECLTSLEFYVWIELSHLKGKSNALG
jgi:hypothetical protein